MLTDIFDEIFDKLKAFVTERSQYSPSIVKGVPPSVKPPYPLIVVNEITNQYKAACFGNAEMHSTLGYSLDIYANDKVYDGIMYSKMQIARELQKITDDFMSKRVKARLVSCAPDANVDKTLYRILMRYIMSVDEKTQILY
jgi:hypothetical protein